MLGDKLERDMFPEGPESQARRIKAMQDLAAKGLALAKAMGAMKGQGTGAGASSQVVTALRGLYRTPWEMALPTIKQFMLMCLI